MVTYAYAGKTDEVIGPIVNVSREQSVEEKRQLVRLKLSDGC